MAVDVSDFASLAQDFETASGRVGPLGRAALVEQADVVQDMQQQLVPKDSWDLHDHITARTQGDGRSATMWAEIGPTGEDRGHGWFVENGTARMPAQPFVEPATEAAAKAWPARVERVMDDVIADL